VPIEQPSTVSVRSGSSGERPRRDAARLTTGDEEIAHARFIAEAGRILGESLDFETTLRRVAELAVPRIADWCAVQLLTDDGELEDLALAHEDPSRVALVNRLQREYPLGRDPAVGPYAVAQTGQSLLVPEITPEMLAGSAVDERHAELLAQLDLRSYMCVALRASGEILGALTLATDTSRRQFGTFDLAFAEDIAGRAASAIANARAFRAADRFRRILDAVGEAVFVVDPSDSRIKDVNQGALALLGQSRDEVIGREIWSLARDAKGEPADHLIQPLVDGRIESRTLRMSLQGTDGAIPVEILFQRVDLPGEPGGVVAIARDVRERVDAQARLHRLAEAEHARAAELNAVIRAMGDGVVVCGPDGRITLSNPAARELFPSAEAYGYDDILAQLSDPDGLAPRLGGPGGPVQLATKDDPDRWIEVTTYPVGADRADTPGGETIVVLRDVTRGRQREAVRETFIGVLSHELRTPITTIYGGAKILARPDGTVDEATKQAIFTDIAEESERLQRLVEDVVALNRFGEDDGDLGHEPVLLQRVVPAVVRSEEQRWLGVRFDLDIPPGMPTVVADPTYVEQVVRNLLSNAAKYSGPGSIVEARLEAAEDEVQVRILDDGPGIEPGEADRLFELFYRSPATARVSPGAGIGLFVCARLVRAMGGRIWARPRPAGGAEFGFALRIMEEA
jgi:two-component system sensor histidine kinase BarA